ncbi:MAG: AAA family ATPase [Candidatus Omnitrophica bacterium]|nr:AAA family ATPase [Candidatus Omnitrophota bacterium]
MGYVIAITGKGGTGKTTLAALIVRLLRERKAGSLLAVDADPNSNLAEVLGVKSSQTIGAILDDISAHPENIPYGMPKDRFIEYQVQSAIVENDGFDLLTMGRPEGPGCYCYVNNVLRNTMDGLIKDYDYIVIDNEAGLEHLSRRTTRRADTLLVVSDATVVGLKAAARIKQLAEELKIQTKNELLVINAYDKNLDEKKMKDIKLKLIGIVPYDKEIEKAALDGGSVMGLSHNAVSLAALRKLGEKLW